jgi:hypothetical protein
MKASVLVAENGNPGPIAMSLAPLWDKNPDDGEAPNPCIQELHSCEVTEEALSWVARHCKRGETDLVVVVDIGEGIGSRLRLIDQVKRMPVKIPIILVADQHMRLDERVLGEMGFDIILKPTEMVPVCRMKRSHPGTDICHYAFIWPKKDDGITLDGIALADIIRSIIECQHAKPL